MTQKTCSKCDTAKTLEDFPKQKSSKDGRNRWCRECYREWHRARYVPKDGGTDAPRECVQCGSTYTPTSRNGKQRFCSPACKMKARYWRANPAEAKVCLSCGEDITGMRRDARYCSDRCTLRHRRETGRITRESRRADMLKSKYGMTLADYDRMLTAQGGGCGICGSDGQKGRWSGLLHVDHCHETGKVRGLLCDSCNLALGKFKDDPNVLRRAAEYIEFHQRS